MTLHADVPEFVPSSAAPPFIPSSASLSSLAPPNEQSSSQRGRKLSASSASSSRTGAGEGSALLARSISSSSNGGEATSQSGHARSHSVPHHSASRGGSIPRGASRGRGSARGGSSRGGGRGGSAAGSGHGASASHSHIPTPRNAPGSHPAPVPQPSVKLDSVDEFPALGGGAPAHPSSGPSTSPVHPISSGTVVQEESETTAISPTAEKDAPAHSAVVESGTRKSISFARIVAPAPPTKPDSSQPSSTNTTSSSSTTSPTASPAFAQIASNRGPRSISAESTSSASTSTTPSSGFSGHSFGRPSEQPVSPRETGLEASVSAIALSDKSKHHGQPHAKGKKAQHQHHGDSPGSGAYGHDRDPLAIVPPQHNERPHFEPRHDAQQRSPRLPEQVPHPAYQAQMQPPPPVQPALTPLQIAFIEQNGLAVEGLPNLAGSTFAIQSLHEYYGQAAVPGPGGPDQGGMTRSASQGQGLTKKQKKAQKAQEEQWRLYQQQQQQQQQFYDFDGQQQGPHGQQGPQPYQPGRDRHSAPHSPNQAFHFHADAPTFTPHSQPSLHADAKEFQPSSVPSNDAASSHERRPHEEPVLEEQVEKLDSEDVKFAVQKADAAVPDRNERDDLPNGHDPTSYDADEKPKSKDKEALSKPAADGAEVLDAVSEDAAKPEQENPVSEQNEDVAQAKDAEIATNEQQPLELKSEQDQREAGLPDAKTILEADRDVPDARDRDDLPAGHSQQAYGEDEQPKASVAVEAAEGGNPAEADEKDDDAAEALEAASEQEAIPEQELPAKEATEQLTDSTSAVAVAEGLATSETSGVVEGSVSSPPHSTFSLLPPVSVEDVLDKALDFVGLSGSTGEAAGDASPGAKKAIEAPSSPTEAKSNLDELDLDTDDDDKSDEPQASTQDNTAEAPTAHDAKANIDELDLPTDDAGDEEVSRIESATARDINADDLPSPRAHLHNASASGSTPADFDISKHSMSPSEVEESLMSPADGDGNGQPLDQELASAAASSETAVTSSSKPVPGIGPDWEVISSSDERCTVENGGTEMDEGEDTENEDADRSTRSAAPSPQLTSVGLPKTSSSPSARPTSIAIPPPVIVSPSSPMVATFTDNEAIGGSPSSRRSSVSPVPTTPKPLADPQAGQLGRPHHSRTPSESERQQAQRLVQELRSEPPTPAGEADKENVPPAQIPTTPPADGAADASADGGFRFDVSALGNSAKRKRGKKDERLLAAADEDGEDDKKKRRQDDVQAPSKNGTESGDGQGGEKEAPSLTLSIFSGSIVSRKSLVLSVVASLGINILLPFVNGIMLGFGEIVARDWVGPLLGFGRRPAQDEPARGLGRFSTAGLGLRSSGRGGAPDIPGHPAAKTALETVAGEVAQAAQLE